MKPDLQTLIRDDLAMLSRAIEARTADTPRLRQGERREVAILFLDLKDFTSMAEGMDHELLHDLVGGVMAALSRVVEVHGGYVDKIQGDQIMALFGARTAGENDCVRAVACGMKMLETVSGINETLREAGIELAVRIGISSGQATVAPDALGHLTAMGDAVNLASRMETSAQVNTLQVPEHVRTACGDVFEWKDLGYISVKGKAEDIHVFTVTGPGAVQKERWERAARISKSRLVGRTGELRLLEEAWERQVSGAPGKTRLGGSRHIALRVVGEAGIGKSRLVHDFLLEKRKTDDSYRLLQGQTLSFAQPQFWIWISLVRSCLGIDLGEAGALGKLESRVGLIADSLDDRNSASELVASIPFLADLLSIPVDESKLQHCDDGMKYSEKMIAVRNLVRALGSLGRTVLLMDDLHCMDNASRETLEFVLSNCETRYPLLVLALYRPDAPIEPVPPVPEGYAEVSGLVIERIPDESCMELMEGMLGSRISPTAAAFILERSSGNPFFLEELIMDLIESGKIVEEDGVWGLAGPPGDIYVPSSLNGLVRSRIDRLPADRKMGLQFCSVLGMEFLMTLYRRLHEKLRNEGDPEGILTDLVQMDFLCSAQETVGLKFMFRHILIHDSAYDSLLYHNRRSLHRYVAEAIEEIFPDEADSLSPVIAWHWERSGNRAMAIRWGIRALDNCARTFQNEEGLAWADKLRDWLDKETDDPRRHVNLLEVLKSESEIFLVQGRYGNVLENLDRMEGLVPYEGGDEWLLQIHDKRGEVYRVTGRSGEAGSEFGAAIELARKTGSRQQERSLLCKTGLVLASRGRGDEARKNFSQALLLAREEGDRTTEGHALNNLGNLNYRQGRMEDAVWCFQQALDIAVETGDRRTEGIDRSNLGNLMLVQGRMQEAAGHFERALLLSREVGDRRSEGVILMSSSILRASLGDMDGALEYMDHALEIARETGERHFEASVLGTRGSQQVLRGQPEAAMDSFGEALRIYREIEDRDGEGTQLCSIGHLKAGSGDPVGALDDCREALRIHRETLNQRYVMRDLSVLGRVCLEAGRPEEAEECCREAREMPPGVGDRMAEADTLTAMAGIRLAGGDPEGAAGYWVRAASIVDEVSRPRVHCGYLEDVRRRLADAGLEEERIPLPSCWS
jgi:adenylate cyclase